MRLDEQAEVFDLDDAHRPTLAESGYRGKPVAKAMTLRRAPRAREARARPIQRLERRV